ncbi:CASP8 and FADD-like apoptosis regulator [Echeneis naucrates]|uniref:CASP8 and FADD-like apoptosis regulator n=1 Tax=Echeneis naucrates TaxID=173247 RepID=A0A665WZW6_ECHNA|nr:CASP8 and FADD-like apoptosis regulator [Echeneis naucrates]XP_029385986.1 CASP8 and FADD-like apoptosis regulator [Echeneis naucrates]
MAPVDQQELQAIQQVAEDLSSSERRIILYLFGKIDADYSVASVKDMLESKVVGQEGGRQLLAELLVRLRRFDILRKVYKISRDEMDRTLQCQQILPRFRVLMANVSEEMTHENLSSLKFLLSSTIPREKMENSKNFLDVIIELEKLDLVSPERVDFIEDCFNNIGRNDLAKKVSSYKMPVVTTAHHSSQQQKRRAPCTYSAAWIGSHLFLQKTQGQSIHMATETRPHIQQSCQSALDRYKFNSNPRGVCVIIDCVGNDGDMLEQTFKALHFSVTIYKWLSVEDTLSTLRNVFKQGENHKGDAFVCCIISRGTANHLLGTDSHSTRLHLDNVRSLFTADTCPMMAGKPKLFFIQRYSVPEYQPSARMHHRDEDLETDGCDELSKFGCIPTDADVFWSHCSTDEHQLEQGHHRSLYLKVLTDALLKGQRRKAKLVDIHTEVNGAIFDHNKRNPAENYRIDLKHTLRKDLCLQ